MTQSVKLEDRTATLQSGQGLAEYALLLGLIGGVILMSLTLLGGSVSDSFGRINFDNEASETAPQVSDGSRLRVHVVDAQAAGVFAARVFVYNDQGTYLSQFLDTSAQGTADFELPAAGRYQFLVQFQEQYVWSETVDWPADESVQVEVSGRPFAVKVQDINGGPLSDVLVYVFDESGNYLGVISTSDYNGMVRFGVREGQIQVRADYGNRSYWSDVTETAVGELTLTINSCARNEFMAEYFNNRTLDGDPVLVQCETAVNYDWGTSIPQPGLGQNQFSVRWTGQFEFEEATYQLSATADDGVRVWVDEELLIDGWRNQSATTYQTRQALSAGVHSVRMQYYENGGQAVAKLNWQPVVTECPDGQFYAEYFNNRALSGAPAVTRCESEINADWGRGRPQNGINADNFSVRWTGRFSFEEATYLFSTMADDGVRIWVDGDLIIDEWRSQRATSYVAQVALTPGHHEVRMEYFENGGDARVKLGWETAVTSCPDGQFLAEYYDNLTFEGVPVFTHCTVRINHDWNTSSPMNGVPSNNFSVRWTGTFYFNEGEYRFTARADDGIRVLVGNRTAISGWRDQSATTYTSDINLPAGSQQVTVFYYERGGHAVAQLSWAPK